TTQRKGAKVSEWVFCVWCSCPTGDAHLTQTLRPWRPLRLCVQAPADKALIGGRCHPAFTNGKHYRMRGIGSRRISWGGEKGARRSRKSSSSKPGELRKKVAMGNSIQMRSA